MPATTNQVVPLNVVNPEEQDIEVYEEYKHPQVVAEED